jgi:hypothetical protein
LARWSGCKQITPWPFDCGSFIVFSERNLGGVKARLDDRLGVSAVTYLLFGVTLGPGLALFLILVFAIWNGWRWLCRKYPAVAWASMASAEMKTLIA